MSFASDIPVQDWALPGEPFRLVAVEIGAAEWGKRLSAGGRARAERFTDPTARARAGASEWLKACWLPGELGVERVEWTTGLNGKPLLAGEAANWGFNVSHADAHAVAVLARGAHLGVDLEAPGRQADIERLGRRVFSESEREQVRADGREAFFDLWSRKEALLKALGCGWADGRIVRRTRLERIAFQIEPATQVKVWSRRVLNGAYALAVAMV